MDEKKNYIIVDEWNTWRGTLSQVTQDELKEEVEFIRQCMKEDGVPDGTDLLAFEFVGSSFHV